MKASWQQQHEWMDGYRDPTAVDQHHQSAGRVELGDEGDHILQVSCQLLVHAVTDGAQAGPRLSEGTAVATGGKVGCCEAAGLFCMCAPAFGRYGRLQVGCSTFRPHAAVSLQSTKANTGTFCQAQTSHRRWKHRSVAPWHCMLSCP